ncbi:gamma-glutamyl-gamma-aminobutyrate hydrolase family protein [Thiosulfativibrio zosterae]|uniref:Glutamine amidotransferase n=1 Tax=Thiosulfativibrio zosterae TaxID=2675053 RepID=A0A6F8PLX6_9GAMM|nr:gamma-glutamyl-gamma-aminobutyrate hydrolase family protein [Thiosulfativibrio zosterae]BBP43109.1 glutamine amidotransferase [Thiosulfativibrio zosterae]
MKRIGISQRRDDVPNRNETRDSLDVIWSSLLWRLNIIPIPLCSEIQDHLSYLAALNLDGFILSGGNDIGESPKRDHLENSILDYSKAKNLPVLGVCRGMQYINFYQGGSLINIGGHVATQHSKLVGGWVSQNSINYVNSFHNYAVTDQTIGEQLEPLAHTEDGVVEALQHKHHPWLGIMWHPEREPYQTSNDRLIQQHFKV